MPQTLHPEPGLTFAIGDVHGEHELLRRALAAVATRARGSRYRVVMLGDYVDRGPDSANVIRLLRQQDSVIDLICLKGNHEAMMVKAYDTGDRGQWFRNGGEATMNSYRGVIARADIEWMRELPVLHADRHRIYVHGGLQPGVPLEEQKAETCMWIRDPFLIAKAEQLPAHVVHGHTPIWQGKERLELVECLPHRTNLDTAAFSTGRLSIGMFITDRPGGPVDVMQIRRPGPVEP